MRAAVEATVREVKHPFPAGKLPVRGKFRMTCMLIGSAAMTNVRRIQRYLAAKQEQENECKETKRRRDITWDHNGDFFLRFFNIAYQAPGWRIDPV